MAKKRNFKKRSSFFTRAVVCAFVVFCGVTLFSQQIEFSELDAEKRELNNSIYIAEENIEELTENLARPMDDEYIKQIARLRLNYHMPDEIIFYNDLLK